MNLMSRVSGKQYKKEGHTMRNIFGTDGVRGVANEYPMTVEVALSLGRAIAYVMKSQHERSKIIIGKDTRISCYMFEEAIAAGICSMGVDVYLVGPMPTPGVAFLTKSMRADAGVMISASHNHYQDNGIKFFSRDGFKLPDKDELEIESLLSSEKLARVRPIGKHIGKAYRVDDAYGRYIEFLKKSFPKEQSLEGYRIVLDCAHGATYKIAPILFSELGAEVTSISVSPNGFNINDSCGSQYTEALIAKVHEQRADLGIAFDGDGDRVIFVDDKGNTIDGDHQMAYVGIHLKKEGKLKKNTVVSTIMSNLGFEKALMKEDIQLIRSRVGDRYVVERMIADGYNFGGEQSGHIVFLDHHTTGDGIIGALQVLSYLCKDGIPITDLLHRMHRLPQILVNVKVEEKKKNEDITGLVNKIAEIERALGKEGRVLVRPSGTEPKIRVMVEGENETLITQYAEELVAIIENDEKR
jgi:phosphoglucosamine mutase